MKDIIKKLNEFKEIEPDEKYWHVSRSVLLNTIKLNKIESKRFQLKSLFLDINIFFRTFFPSVKVATISLVVIAMVFVTGLGAQAAGPSNFLFTGKLIIEKGQLFLAKDSEKTNIHFKHIENRLKEIDQLIKENKSKHIAKATKNIESNLKQVQKDLELMKNNKKTDNHKVVELATLIDEKTNQISEVLKEKSNKLKDKEKTEELAKTVEASYSLGKEALDIIVNSNSKLTESELNLIENSINNKIELQKDRFERIGEEINKVKENIVQSKQKVNLVNQKTTTTIFNDLESKNVISTTSNSNNNFNDSQKKIEENERVVEFNINEISDLNSVEITSKLEKAQELLEKGDYTNALRKLKEAEFYIDLTKESTTNALNDAYSKQAEDIEKKIKEKEEVRGETEQVLE